METGELNIFFAEFDDQLNEIGKVIEKIEDRREGISKDVRLAESLAYQFHNLYCAIEDLFKVVARFFENHIVNTSGYHIELLNRMTLRIEGVRPALMSKETAKLVNEFRAFRHLFRHAYSYDIDVDKMQLLIAKLKKFKGKYQQDVLEFTKEIPASQDKEK